MIRAVSFLILASLCSCSSRWQLRRELKQIGQRLQEHTGFVLYDPVRKKPIVQHQSDRYFTPASNTKIFTFYTALNLLGDSVPAIKYEERGDSLIFWGMGDPSFLYRKTFSSSTVFNFLKDSPSNLFFSPANFETERFGPGWAWDDYRYSYSAERSSFPIYGNLVELKQDSLRNLVTVPPWFQNQLVSASDKSRNAEPERQINTNNIIIHGGPLPDQPLEIPFHYSDLLLCDLLTDTLKKTVGLVQTPPGPASKILRGTPSDSLYKVMMQESDNFIAEQLLLMCAGVLTDTLKPEAAITYAKKNWLADLPDDPHWVDGSGLSRYNLFTPRSVVRLWEKIYEMTPRERLFPLLATGGKYGTLKSNYKSDTPYIFGKTGTLSNNHCLSGFIQTKRDRTLIFSFMHNNYVQPTRFVRQEMERFLRLVRDKY